MNLSGNNINCEICGDCNHAAKTSIVHKFHQNRLEIERYIMTVKISIEKIYDMFFSEGKTVSAIADVFKVDKSYVSRILKQKFSMKYKEEKEKRKINNKEKQVSSKNMDKDGRIYSLYFIEGKKSLR